MNKNQILLLITILLLIVVTGCFFSYKAKQSKIYNQNIEALNDTVAVWKNRYGKTVSEKKAFLVGDNELLDVIQKLNMQKLDIENQLKKFKGTKTVIVNKTEFRIDTLKIYIDSLGIFERKNEYYYIAGRIQDSLELSSIQFYNDQSIIFGEKSQGLFKSRLITAQITNTNPYLKIKDIQSFTTPVPKRRFHLGIQIGGGVTSDFKPSIYVGVGVSFSLLNL